MAKKILAWSVIGSGVSIMLALIAASFGDARAYFAIIGSPVKYSVPPGMVGASVGVAIGFLRS